MTDTQDMPDISIKPGAILTLAIPSDPMYVMESPTEVRGLLSDLKLDYSGSGLGESEGDHSGLLVLTGLELHTRPEVSPEPFEVAVHPQLVGFVKSVHPSYWEDQLKLAKEANDQYKAQKVHEEHGGGPLDQLPGPVRELIEGLAGGNVRMVGMPGGESMTVERFKEGEVATECCCGHEAHQHEVGEKTMGACTKCGCARFHTH